MSGDPVEAVAKGATKGALEYTEEKLKDFVFRLQNHELAFIQAKANIRVVRRERQSSEYKLLCQFLPKGWLRIVVQMGLALRDLSDDPSRTLGSSV